MTRQHRIALASGRLAVSAERLGSWHEVATAGAHCGRLAFAAGLNTDDLCRELQPGELAWCAICDAWYAASNLVAA